MLPKCLLGLALVAGAAAAADVKVVEEIVAKVNGDIITGASSRENRLLLEMELKQQGLNGAGLELQFVRAVCGDQKARLLEKTCRAAVELRPRFEVGDGDALERLDVASVSEQRVVERQHLGDQSRAQTKRRDNTRRDGLSCGGPQQQFAFERRRPSSGEIDLFRQLPVPLLARPDLGKCSRQARMVSARQQQMLERSPQLETGRA